MFATVNAPLRGARSVALTAPEAEFIIRGLDFTGAQFRMEVRDRRNGGVLRAALDTVTSAAAQGVRLVSVETIDGIPVSKIHARINETTMEAMPTDPADPGTDVSIWWGMHITPAGGLKFLAFDGPFIVEASTPA